MARNLSLNQAGYTLIELLLYIAIVGSLLTVITTFFGTAVDARVKGQTISEVDDQGTAVMDQITQSIRNAVSVTTPSTGSSGSTLTLAESGTGVNPTVYSLSGSTLQIKEGTTAAIPIASGIIQISNLTFTNLARGGTPGIVQISFTISRLNPSNRNQYDYQKTFTGSAEVAW